MAKGVLVIFFVSFLYKNYFLFFPFLVLFLFITHKFNSDSIYLTDYLFVNIYYSFFFS